MASEEQHLIIDWYARILANNSIIPIEWDKTTKLLTESSAWRKRVLGYTYFALVLFFNALSCWRIEAIFISQRQTFHPILLLVFGLIVIIVSGELVIFTAFYSGSNLIDLYNQLYITSKRIYKNSKSDSIIRKRNIFKYIQILYLIAASFNAFVFGGAEYYYMWKISSNYTFAIIIAVVHGFLFQGAIIIFGFIQVYIFLYFSIVKTSLKGDVSADNVDELVLNYKSLTILSNFFNRSYCRIIVPGIKFLLCAFFMICTVIATTSVGTPIICAGFVAGALYGFLLILVAAKVTSGVYEISSTYLWNFKHSMECTDEKEFARLVAKSFAPIRFAIGSFYYMEKEAKLTLAYFLFDQTVDLLITVNASLDDF